jgi:hypothetical protein
MFFSSYLKFIVYRLIGILYPSLRNTSSFWETVVRGLREQPA